jgi:hypothetical protein
MVVNKTILPRDYCNKKFLKPMGFIQSFHKYLSNTYLGERSCAGFCRYKGNNTDKVPAYVIYNSLKKE